MRLAIEMFHASSFNLLLLDEDWMLLVRTHNFHLQAYEKREETRLGDDHPEALVITVQTNECLGIGGGQILAVDVFHLVTAHKRRRIAVTRS